MTSGGVLVVLFLLGIGALAVSTLVIAVRGGPGAGAPPASRPHLDPNGFPVLAPQRGLFERRQRRSSRPATARIAAAVHTARESRTARAMSAVAGPRPLPSAGRTSTRLP